MSDAELRDIIAEILSEWGPSRAAAIRKEAAKRGHYIQGGEWLRTILEQEPERFKVTSQGWMLETKETATFAVDVSLRDLSLPILSVAYLILKGKGRSLEIEELIREVLLYRDALPSSVRSMVRLDPRLMREGSRLGLREWSNDIPDAHEVCADNMTHDFTPTNWYPSNGKANPNRVKLDEVLDQDSDRFDRNHDDWSLRSGENGLVGGRHTALQDANSSEVPLTGKEPNEFVGKECIQCGQLNRTVAVHCGKCGTSLAPDVETKSSQAGSAGGDYIQLVVARFGHDQARGEGEAGTISALELSTRTHNALIREGIVTIEQLRYIYETFPERIWQIRNMGARSVMQIHEALERHDEMVANGSENEHEQAAETQFTIRDVLGLSGYLTTPVPLSDLGFDVRTANALNRNGVQTVNDLCECSIEDLRRMRNVGVKMVGEVELKLKGFWNDLPTASLTDSEENAYGQTGFHKEGDPAIHAQVAQGTTRIVEPDAMLQLFSSVNILAQQHGITTVPKSWSWVDLLDLGYDWRTLEALDAALHDAELPSLVPLPDNPVVSSETVRYLLDIGCPLHRIPARRMTLDGTKRRLLLDMKLTSALSLCLADADRLSERASAFGDFQREVSYYVEWLGTQSDWSHEIFETQPGPLALRYLNDIRLGDLVERLFVGQPRRSRDVRGLVIMRYGLDQRQESTLQEVAQEFGITRERVRQLCGRAMNEIRGALRQDEILQAFVWFCKDVVVQASVINSDALIEEVTGHLNISIEGATHIIQFLLDLDGTAGYARSLDLWVSPSIPVAAVETVISSAKSQLQQARAPMRVSELVCRLKDVVELDADLLNDQEFVQKCLQVAPELVHVEGDYWGLLSWQSRITDDIVMVLRNLGRPAHFKEITRFVNQRLREDQYTTPRLVHAKLEHYEDLFVRTGPGTFALRELNLALPAQPIKYIDLIEQVLQEEGRPLGINEIFRRVHAMREAKMSSIAMYLSWNIRFSKLGRDLYGLAQWRQQEEPSEPEARTAPEIALPSDFLEQLKSKALGALRAKEAQDT